MKHLASYWIDTQVWVETPVGMAFIWEGLSFAEQQARDYYVCCFADGRPARYYHKREIMFRKEEKAA